MGSLLVYLDDLYVKGGKGRLPRYVSHQREESKHHSLDPPF